MHSRRDFMFMSLAAGTVLSIGLGPGSAHGESAVATAATAVTQVFGDGIRLTAVALDYGQPVNGSDLTAARFTVEGRTVTGVFTSTSADPADRADAGNFVIVTLSPDDETAPLAEKSERPGPSGNAPPQGVGGGAPAGGPPGGVGNAGDIPTYDDKYKAAEARVVQAGRYGPRLRSHAFTRTNRSVESVRHAVAIDEHRVMFRPQHWPEGAQYWGNPFNAGAAKPQDAKEVWFAGSHGDVGGGYAEKDSALLKIPLHWMIAETGSMGLHYRTQSVNELVLGKNPAKHYVQPDALAAAHNSMNWVWSLLEVIPQWREVGLNGSRRLMIPLFARRPIPDGARLHCSVVDRVKAGIKSPNMPSSYQIEGPP